MEYFTMKVIIAGSRNVFPKPQEITEVMNIFSFKPYSETSLEIVCGLAKGADMEGKFWASDRDIPVKEFPANWQLYGTRAGILRNLEMARYADALVAFWNGKSRGTKHMIKAMLDLDKPVHVQLCLS